MEKVIKNLIGVGSLDELMKYHPDPINALKTDVKIEILNEIEINWNP
ncbi:hypothetical protein [Mycoplasmopsis anatis]